MEEIQPNDNPRLYLNNSIACILSDVVNAQPFTCKYNDMCQQYTSKRIDDLIRIGLFRAEKDQLLLNSTVIIREDLEIICKCLAAEITHLADKLTSKISELYQCVSSINNGFDERRNLYHLLCSSVLDGSFFDYLSENQALAISHLQPSGIDYIITVYEKCSELDRFANHLLCSCNRFCDGARSLQSFGDANGERIDFYRFNCQNQLGTVPPALKQIEAIWNETCCIDFKSHILDELQTFDKTGICDPNCMRLFEAFEYINNGQYTVPVFRHDTKAVIAQLTEIVIDCIGNDVREFLRGAPIMSKLYFRQHGVPKEEAANEVYHILFGMLNEELVSRGIVQKPSFHDGEGRYLKSIELYIN